MVTTNKGLPNTKVAKDSTNYKHVTFQKYFDATLNIFDGFYG